MSALSQLKVLDLSRILAGPWASQMLADMGAEVIKVERPEGGDDTRRFGPPFLQDDEGNETQESAYYLSTNRGKQSVCIDLSNSEGQQTIRKLVKECDVLIENFKVGGMEKYGLDYASLAEINPRLIYCSITGFGQTGPYRHRLGYDFMIQAMGGLMSVTGEAEGQPQRVGVAHTDILTGLYASNAILAALLEREKSGQGQHIDLALFDVSVATLANQASNYLVGGEVPTRIGNAHPNIVPYQVFETADGFCVITVGNDSQYQSFATLLSRPDLASDPRFSTNKLRVQNREILVPIIQTEMRQQTSEHWLRLCESHNVPAGPVNNIDQVFADPQVHARDMLVTLPLPDSSHLKLSGNPIKFSRTPIEYRSAPPKLGEHTDSVLDSLLKPKVR